MQTVTEATKAAIIAVREVDHPFNNARPKHKTPRSGGPALGQPTFNWKTIDKYHEVYNFEIKVKNIPMTDNYNMKESKQVPPVLNWLNCEGLRFVQMLNKEEQWKMQNNHRDAEDELRFYMFLETEFFVSWRQAFAMPIT